jgi:hypothetical protein
LDPIFISERLIRAKAFPSSVVPEILVEKQNLYSYKKVEGRVLSEFVDSKKVINLLNFAKNTLWVVNKDADTKKVISSCYSFYRDKTFDRVKFYLNRFERHDKPLLINSKSVLPALELLNKVNWDFICESPHISNFHGDFHNENILVSDDGSFKFLDWRQNFGEGNYEHGDAYYDFAKFLHGLIINHGVVRDHGFKIIKLSDENVQIDILRPLTLIEAEKTFRSWLKLNGFDVLKVDFLCALIFLNIAGLHEDPYSEFLYLIGRYLLSELVEET